MKATVIGAGSVIWGSSVIHDLLSNEKVNEGTISLVDVDKNKLKSIHEISEILNEHEKQNFEIKSSTDRREMLPDSDFVMILAEEDRIKTWKRDCEILEEFDIDHPLAENRGPGGLSHTLRTVPLVMDMCRDIEELCPDSLSITLTNPEDRITYAAHRYTDIEMIGYCDGLWDFKSHHLGDLLDIPPEDIYVRGAGINHCVWITEMLNRRTGEDLYPRLVKKSREGDWQPFSRHLYENYGLWPYENDEHVGEYFREACEFFECEGHDFDGHEKMQDEWKTAASKVIQGTPYIEEYVEKVANWNQVVFGDLPLTKIVEGVYLGEEQYLPNVNLPNEGKIDNLPDDMIIEEPGVATPGGVQGERFGRLPIP